MIFIAAAPKERPTAMCILSMCTSVGKHSIICHNLFSRQQQSISQAQYKTCLLVDKPSGIKDDLYMPDL